jgi:NAD(P)H-dependent flavin oxidoreductase YrpB (nitropropane dioxygenase family)
MAGATTVDMVVATAGTAYLLCPEARTPAVYASALATARDDNTAITNVFTGRPARSVVNRLARELGPFRRRPCVSNCRRRNRSHQSEGGDGVAWRLHKPLVR